MRGKRIRSATHEITIKVVVTFTYNCKHAEIIAEMQEARGPDAAHNDLFFGAGHFPIYLLRYDGEDNKSKEG